MKTSFKRIFNLCCAVCMCLAMSALVYGRGSGSTPEPPVDFCVGGGGYWDDNGACVFAGDNSGGDSGEESGSNSGDSSAVCTSLPSLEDFTISQSSYSKDEIELELTPNGDPGFYLHVNIYNDNGIDVLSTWCTGDEALCKAVGNGQTCVGEDYTGSNAWCYLAN